MMTDDQYVDPISKALNAATPIGSLPRPVVEENLPAVIDESEPHEIEDDYQEARSNIKELISQTMEQIPDLINLMSQSQNEKMISAVSGFIKTAGDLNLNMSKLSKDIKTPKTVKGSNSSESSVGAPQSINAIFVGSTEEFLRKLREDRKAQTANLEPVDAEFTEVTSSKNDS